MKKYAYTSMIGVVVPLFFSGCGQAPIDPGSDTAGRALPDVVAARVIGRNSILVEFSAPAGELADEPSSYVISDANAKALAVHEVGVNEERTEVRLTTAELVDGASYTMTVLSGVEPVPIDPPSPPRVVGAVSTSNTMVVVTFTNNMRGGALDPTNYFIVQEDTSPEAGVLHVTSAVFLLPQKDAVRLRTLPQNEVAYSLHVVNVRDVFGTQLAPPELLVDPSRATFRGRPTSCRFTCSDGSGPCPSEDDSDCPVGATCICETQDTDGDGLPDHIEQRGWTVEVELTNREGVFDRRPPLARDVTSDPLIADTDGDGLSDFTERELGTDPRNPDTDGDGLTDEREFNLFFSNPVDQDTDEDHLDDFLEVSLYKTSPILADTDGDGLDDDVEVLELNRDPRLADLPEWEIDVGDLRIQIDERYTFVDETGETVTELSSTSSTFTQSDETSKLKFNSNILREGWELGGKLTISTSPSFVIEGKGFRNSDAHSGSDTTTTRALQEAYESSLSKGREFTTTRQVTREVFGASISAPLTIRSTGDIAFSISNLELSVLQLGPDRRSFIPVATLVPNATLLTGETTTLNLGPLLDERGPINLGTQEVFPSLVESLMRAPRGPIIVPANFDITDEFGRNFAFTSQEVNDRTATLLIDLGDGTVEEYNIAIAGSIDNKGFVGPAGEFVGGFDDEGRTNGIPMDYALQDILRLTKETDPPVFDSITAGLNGVAETVAAGDDIQIFNTAIQGLSDISVIIVAGDNGILDTVVLNGDDEFAVTEGYATSPTCNEFTNQRIEEPGDGEGDGFVNTVPDGDDVYAAGLTAVGDAVLPGDEIILAGPNGIIDSVPSGDDVLRGPGEICERDLDCQATTCIGGTMSGSLCESDDDCVSQPVCETLLGFCIDGASGPCMQDADCVIGTGICIPNPPQPGTCQGTGEFCGNDDDCIGTCVVDMVCSQDSLDGGQPCAGDGDCRPSPGICEVSVAECNGREVLKRYKSATTGQRNRAWIVYSDEQIPFGTSFGDIILKPRMKIFLGFEQDIDRDGLFARHEFGFGSSDRSKDTDGDGLSDPVEVREGWIVEIVGEAPYRAFPDPRLADSDGDGISDLMESFCKTDPRKRDTDGDGIDDFAELNDEGVLPADCNDPSQNPPTHLDPLNPDTDGDGIGDGIEVVLGLDNLDPLDAEAFLDTDDDGLANVIETGGWDVTVVKCNNSCAQAFDDECQENVSSCTGTFNNGGMCNNISQCNAPAQTAPECIVAGDESFCTGAAIPCESDFICSINLCFPGFPSGGTCFIGGAACDPGLQDCPTFGTCELVHVCDTNSENAGEECDPNGNDCDARSANTCELRGKCTNNAFHECVTDSDCNFGSCEDAVIFPRGTCSATSGGIFGRITCQEDEHCQGVCNFDLAFDRCSDLSLNARFPCLVDAHCFAHVPGVCMQVCASGSDCADCGSFEETYRAFSDPTVGDTDFDGLPDAMEFAIGSDPDDIDTDDDGLLDFNEFADFGRFFSLMAQHEGFFFNASASDQIGTSLTSQDTDGDGLPDDMEYLSSWQVFPLDNVASREVFSNPLLADSDFDTLSDYDEFLGADGRLGGGDATDPSSPDTDGDSRSDGDELGVGSNPLQPDLFVEVSILELRNFATSENTDEWDFRVRVRRPLTGEHYDLLRDQHSIICGDLGRCGSFVCDLESSFFVKTDSDFASFVIENRSKGYTIPFGEPIVIEIFLREGDGCGENNELVEYTCSMFFTEVLSTGDLLSNDGYKLIEATLSDGECTGTFVLEVKSN